VIEVAVDGNCPEADVEGMLKVDVAWISVSGREISRRGERAIESGHSCWDATMCESLEVPVGSVVNRPRFGCYSQARMLVRSYSSGGQVPGGKVASGDKVASDGKAASGRKVGRMYI
jgi:hypothetical protein